MQGRDAHLLFSSAGILYHPVPCLWCAGGPVALRVKRPSVPKVCKAEHVVFWGTGHAGAGIMLVAGDAFAAACCE